LLANEENPKTGSETGGGQGQQKKEEKNKMEEK